MREEAMIGHTWRRVGDAGGGCAPEVLKRLRGGVNVLVVLEDRGAQLVGHLVDLEEGGDRLELAGRDSLLGVDGGEGRGHRADKDGVENERDEHAHRREVHLGLRLRFDVIWHHRRHHPGPPEEGRRELLAQRVLEQLGMGLPTVWL